MSVFARKTLFHPQWLAIAGTLSVGWLLFRPLDVTLVPSVRPASHVQTDRLEDGPSGCPERDGDGTCVVAASEVHLSAPPVTEPVIPGPADEGSIYANAVYAADPFQVPTSQSTTTTVTPVQYCESVESTCLGQIQACDHVVTRTMPVRLPALPSAPTSHDTAAVAVSPPTAAEPQPARTCLLTDRQSGVSLATLKISPEIRSEELDLANYQHIPCKNPGSDEPTCATGLPCLESAPSDSQPAMDLVTFESPQSTEDATSGVEAVDDARGECETLPAICQTIEQAQQWIHSGHVDEAVDLLTNALFEYPNDVHLLQHIAIAYMAKHDLTSALSAAEQCLAIDRQNADSHEVMSHVLHALGQANRSRHYADQAIFLRGHIRTRTEGQ